LDSGRSRGVQNNLVILDLHSLTAKRSSIL
jgi:hypothetical protein